MSADSFKPSRIACAAFLIGVFIAPPAIANASDCPADTTAIVTQAKAALGKAEQTALTGEERVALSCLADAIGAVNAKLEDLIAGKVVFTGPVVTQKGFFNQGDKPTTEAAR